MALVMKHAMRAVGQHLTAHRMAREYVIDYYTPAVRNAAPLFMIRSGFV